MIMRPMVLALALALCATSCSHETTTEARVRSALDLLADVVDPSYQFAVDACIAQERDAVRRFEAGSDPARDEYVAIKSRCQNVRAAFDQIRRGHARAAELVESGKVQEAEREVARVRGYWHVLYERDDHDGGAR